MGSVGQPGERTSRAVAAAELARGQALVWDILRSSGSAEPTKSMVKELEVKEKASSSGEPHSRPNERQSEK